MMLSLIERTNATYRLGLDADQRAQLHVSLRRRLGANANPTAVIDAVLATADVIKTRRPRNVYSGMKVQAAIESDRCPRCRADTQVVALVHERPARYCVACHIALPVKRDV